ncbi:hypothetical protein BDF22DRAFT_670788 [Syncephalis plumigaleata]|nr:hypothetical protein BDF22DRAFT_670788 [Syncephalis plumigaleata]
MEHISVYGSSEAVSTLRLLRLLRPIKTKLAALIVFKPNTTKDTVDSLSEALDFSRSSEIRKAAAVEAAKKRSNSTGSNIITYGKVSRSNSNNGQTGITINNKQSNSDNVWYTYNYRAAVSVPVTESPHDYINSMKICDAVNDVLRRTWCKGCWIQHYGKQAEWATVEPFAPWKPLKKHATSMSSSSNNAATAAATTLTDDNMVFSNNYVAKLVAEHRVMPLSIISAFEIGRYAAQIEFMIKDKEKQESIRLEIEELYEYIPEHLRSYVLVAHLLEMCNLHTVFLPQLLDPLIVLCLQHRLTIQAFAFIKTRITHNFPTTRQEFEQLYRMAKTLHKEKEFIDTIVAALTPAQVCSANLMEICMCAPPFVGYSLARGIIALMLSDVNYWHHLDAPYHFHILIQMMTDYCVTHEMSIMKKASSSTAQDTAYYWRQDTINIAMLLVKHQLPSLPVNHCVALCLLAVDFDPTLVGRITEFLRQQRMSMSDAVQMIKHPELILKIGTHFTTISERYVAIALYQQMIDVMQTMYNADKLDRSMRSHLALLYDNLERLNRLQQQSISRLQTTDCKTLYHQVKDVARRISWTNDDDFDLYERLSSPVALMSDTCVESSDPLFSYTSYDDDDTFNYYDDKENDINWWDDDLLLDQQPQVIKNKSCTDTTMTRSHTYK